MSFPQIRFVDEDGEGVAGALRLVDGIVKVSDNVLVVDAEPFYQNGIFGFYDRLQLSATGTLDGFGHVPVRTSS